MVTCFITQQWHQNHWNQHQKHLLLRLLRVLASEEQQHWRGWVWSYGGEFKETRRVSMQKLQIFGKSKILLSCGYLQDRHMGCLLTFTNP